MSLNNSQKVIQLLLSYGESVKKQELTKILELEMPELDITLGEVKNLISPLGLNLIESNSSLLLGLHSDINSFLKKQKMEELGTDLSESALQTLSVIIYRPGATKAEVDFVRGVDSSRSLRNLSLRGLVEQVQEKSRKKYFPTVETLAFLGLTSETEIENHEVIKNKLDSLIRGE